MLNNCEPLLSAADGEKSSQSGAGQVGHGGPESLSGRSSPTRGQHSPPPPIVPFQIPTAAGLNYPQRYLDENGV